MKKLTDEDIEFISKNLETAYVCLANAWKISMKSFPINSKEFSKIRKAGVAVMKARFLFEVFAECKLKWSHEKIKSIFKSNIVMFG